MKTLFLLLIPISFNLYASSIASSMEYSSKTHHEIIDDVTPTPLEADKPKPKFPAKIATSKKPKSTKKVCKNNVCKTIKIHKKFNGVKIPKKR